MGCQGYVSSGGSREESVFFPFPASRGCLHLLGHGKWRNTLWCIHTEKHYTTIKKEPLIHIKTWVNPKIILLSDKKQVNACPMISLTKNSRNYQLIYKDRNQISDDLRIVVGGVGRRGSV